MYMRANLGRMRSVGLWALVIVQQGAWDANAFSRLSD
jgi:hypothetical protein